MKRSVSLLFIALAALVPRVIQSSQPDSYDVFIDYTTNNGPDTLYFVDLRSGLSTVVPATGTDYMLLDNGVIFHDRQRKLPTEASPDGEIAPVSFMSPDKTSAWAASTDGRWITWSESHTEAGSLLVDLFVAHADGSSKQLALHTSSSKAIGLRPLAISRDGQTLYYTRQNNTPSVSAAFPTANDLYRVTVTGGQFTHLPGEPRCACGAAFSADGHLFFRLESTPQGYAAHFIDPVANTDIKIDPPTLPSGFTIGQAGDALLSDNGSTAVYVIDTGAGSKMQQYVLVLADLTQHKQQIIVLPRTDHLQPIAFETDTLLVTIVGKGGTYRMPISGGDLAQLSADVYLGTIGLSG